MPCLYDGFNLSIYMKTYLSRMKSKGKCPPHKTTIKILWSSVGAFLGIFLIGICDEILDMGSTANLFLISSFGASAVLIYSVPLSDFSQPRNFVGGHFVSALVGVTVHGLVPNQGILAAALAVSLAIAAMHWTRTVHPPGGATALLAVIGGEQIYNLGYFYVLSPVLTGSLVMLLVALSINNLSINPKRHYPVYWF